MTEYRCRGLSKPIGLPMKGLPKRRDREATRASILAAARKSFLDRNYDVVGLREIAGEAQVDVALIGRYFGCKQDLFREILLEDAASFEHLASTDELVSYLVTLALENDDEIAQRQLDTIIIMMRSAASWEVGRVIRELVQDNVLDPLAVRIGSDRAQARAGMLLSILIGIAFVKSVLWMNHPADAEQRECLRRLFNAALMA